MIHRFLIFFLLLICTDVQKVKAAIPVLLRLISSAQHDTTGCNFVAELSSLAYNEIRAGKLKLWDGPLHELEITPASLEAICKAAGVKMGVDSGQLIHIYEYWEEKKESINTTTSGILFSARDRNGKDVSFGYIDYADFETACLRHTIKTNVNGDYHATIATYLSSKNFNFSLIQFNTDVVSGVEESSRILSAFRKGRSFNIQKGNLIPVQLKLVKLEIYSDTSESAEEASKSAQFLAKTDSFFRENEEFLYNSVEDSLHSVFQTRWKITGMQVTELWRKDESGISSTVTSVTLIINKKEMTEIPLRLLAGLDFMVSGQPFTEFISRHSYQYRLLSINDQELGRTEAVLYSRALQSAAWNRLSDYVKFY